jgi:hypothetical protein
LQTFDFRDSAKFNANLAVFISKLDEVRLASSKAQAAKAIDSQMMVCCRLGRVF